MQVAWLCCKYVKSNAIVLGKVHKIVGLGAGQVDRVNAAQLRSKRRGTGERFGGRERRVLSRSRTGRSCCSMRV